MVRPSIAPACPGYKGTVTDDYRHKTRRHSIGCASLEQSLGGYPAGVALGVAAASGLPDSVGVVSAGSGWAAAVISARRSTRAV